MKKQYRIPVFIILGLIIIPGFIILSIKEGVKIRDTSLKNNDSQDTSLNKYDSKILEKSSFNQISISDQTRMKEIIIGVMDGAIEVTPAIKTELRNIFKKYNTTDEEINNFSNYGPAFATRYQKLFFTDALASVLSGNPTKSPERLDFETKALSQGLMTLERFKTSDEQMKLISNHQSVVGSNGSEVVFTVDTINSSLKNIDIIMDRLQLLFEPTSQNVNNLNTVSEISNKEEIKTAVKIEKGTEVLVSDSNKVNKKGTLIKSTALRSCQSDTCEIYRYYAETSELNIIEEYKNGEWYKIKGTTDAGGTGKVITGWIIGSSFDKNSIVETGLVF